MLLFIFSIDEKTNQTCLYSKVYPNFYAANLKVSTYGVCLLVTAKILLTILFLMMLSVAILFFPSFNRLL